MRGGGVKRVLCMALVALVAVSCGGSSLASTTPTPTPGDPLDPAVTVPNDFPPDFPVYPQARPVSVNHSTGTTTWEVAWETVDPFDRVEAFYKPALDTGDWMSTSEQDGPTEYSATLERRTEQAWRGVLFVDTTSKQGVVKISAVLWKG